MCDRDQEIFDHAESCEGHLHHIEGSIDALYELLDAPLATCADKGIKVYAILAAVAHFRAEATVETRRVVQLVSGVSA
jgi:hypothetical protein